MDRKKIKKTEEQTSNRVLSVFIAGALLLWAISYLYKAFDMVTTYHTATVITWALFALSCGGAVLSLILHISARKKGGEASSDAVFMPFAFLLLSATLVLCFGLLLIDYIMGMKLIYVIIPAVVIYFLVYNVYQRSFFLLTLTHGVIGVILYCLSGTSGKAFLLAGTIVAVLICLVAIVLTIVLIKCDGCIRLGKSRIRVFDQSALPSLRTVLIVYGVTAAVVLACFLAPIALFIYAFYAMIAFIVCATVYLTIKLI